MKNASVLRELLNDWLGQLFFVELVRGNKQVTQLWQDFTSNSEANSIEGGAKTIYTTNDDLLKHKLGPKIIKLS
jgi:hypothetical protein